MTGIHPRYCLKLGPTQAVLAEIRQGWVGTMIHQCWVRPLPKGLIRPSPVTPNMSDPAALGTQLRALTREQQGLPRKRTLTLLLNFPRPAVLVIPDLSVRPVLLSLDNLPSSHEEQAALVRWRLGQEQLFPLAGTKVVFQILSTGEGTKKGPYTILAIAMRESVLAQYEAACDAAGFFPVEVDTATFRLFNLWVRAKDCPVLLSLDNLPSSHEEQAALVRWRLGQEQLFPLAGTKVVFQILSTGEGTKKGPYTILAIAMRESVLAQYEAACDAAGFFPVEVDTATFRLFNLWVRAKVRAKTEPLDDLAWVSLLDGAMTVLIIRAGRVVYVRSKGWTAGDLSGPLTGLPGEGGNRAIRDMLASIEHCAETQPGLDIRRIILACDEPGSISIGQLRHQLDIDVEEVGWDQARGAGWHSTSKDTPSTGISAVAGLLGR